MRKKRPEHTMTCLVLTAVAVLWPVIGLTVIGTVFPPLRALKMGHNAAVDLAAAVGRKPCNCNFPSSSPFLPPFERWHDHLWVEWISWPSGPQNLVNRQRAISEIHGCQWENEPSIRHSRGACFFADTCIYPTAAFCCCWPSALRESSVWSQHPSLRRPHIHKRGYGSREAAYTGSLLLLTEKYILDHIQVQMGTLIQTRIHATPPRQLLTHPG